MQGACSNQIVKCIIYTSDIEIGINKLLEIENEKNESGIETVFKRISKSAYIRSEIRFGDGEEWIIVNPNNGARGYRWRKRGLMLVIRQFLNCICILFRMEMDINGKIINFLICNSIKKNLFFIWRDKFD